MGVKVHAPCASASAVPKRVAPSYTLTTEFASAVPVMAGVLLLLLAGPLMAGAEGVIVSTTMATADEPALVLPAASDACTERLYEPSAKVEVTIV